MIDESNDKLSHPQFFDSVGLEKKYINQSDKTKSTSPLRRLVAPFDKASIQRLDQGKTIDEALLLIEGDGREYIQPMCFIRKTSPRFADDLQVEGNTILNLEVADTAMKTFFQQRVLTKKYSLD